MADLSVQTWRLIGLRPKRAIVSSDPFPGTPTYCKVSSVPPRTVSAGLLQPWVLEHEKLLSQPPVQAQLPGPLSRGQGAKPSRSHVAYCLRLSGRPRNKSSAHRSAPPPQAGRGGGLASLSLPLPPTLPPSLPHSSLVPYLAIPLAAPSPSLHGLGAPR